MLKQESTTYKCGDYGNTSTPANEREVLSPVSVTSLPAPKKAFKFSEVWREQICDWSYAIVDHFDLDRETVSISFSYLDRFIPRYQDRICHKTYQLVAMTTLYMAIKLHENRKLSISSFISLSRGQFTANHVISMESTILRALSWLVHPPTPLTFINHLILLYPRASPELRNQLVVIARYIAELSVYDYYFVTKKPSSIALACILHAMNDMQVPLHETIEFMDNVRGVNIDPEAKEVYDCQVHLKEIYYASRENDAEREEEECSERIENASPSCVSKIIT